MEKRILFILKRREDYSVVTHSNIGLSTGLYNSAKFMDDMLNEFNDPNIISKLVVVKDNNCIDREVNLFKPTHVIIEALWVVPEKFVVLQNLHPNVKWIIRLHSEMPFMASEGMAMEWIGEYSTFKNIIIGINAPRMLREISFFLKHKNNWSTEQLKEKIIYLPNFYPKYYKPYKTIDKNKEHIDIACFGAVRPLKNHLVQAMASIEFADKINKKLRFHINCGRVEMQGQPVARNLVGLFEQVYDRGHKLIKHQWCPREDFLKICAQMDIGMQVSFSETFNIVTADLISQGVPVIGSTEIPWLDIRYAADPTNGQDIIKILSRTYKNQKHNVINNHKLLKSYTENTQKIWKKYFITGKQ